MLSSLTSQIETEVKFSDARCATAFPLAVAAYVEGLPSHYTKAQHQAKVSLSSKLYFSKISNFFEQEYPISNI